MESFDTFLLFLASKIMRKVREGGVEQATVKRKILINEHIFWIKSDFIQWISVHKYQSNNSDFLLMPFMSICMYFFLIPKITVFLGVRPLKKLVKCKIIRIFGLNITQFSIYQKYHYHYHIYFNRFKDSSFYKSYPIKLYINPI